MEEKILRESEREREKERDRQIDRQGRCCVSVWKI